MVMPFPVIFRADYGQRPTPDKRIDCRHSRQAKQDDFICSKQNLRFLGVPAYKLVSDRPVAMFNCFPRQQSARVGTFAAPGRP